MIQMLKKILGPVEIIAIIITLAALAFTRIELLIIGAYLLAAIFFLNGFMPPPADQDSTGRMDFFDLLAKKICFKVAWIGCSVIMVGVLYRMLHLNGALEMLLVGCSSTFMAIVVMGLYAIMRSPAAVLSPLIRAVPVCLLGAYLFLNKPA